MQLRSPVTAVAWRPDGATLALGGSDGRLELHEAFVKQSSHGNDFHVTFLTMCHVHIKQISAGKLLFQYAFIVFACCAVHH